MKPWAESAATPDCFMLRIPPIRNIRTWSRRVEQRSTEIRNLLLFFELEWLKADDATAKRLIADPALATYQPLSPSLRRYRPHTLSEPEEKIVNEKDNTGRNAFGRLFSEITSSLSFTLERDGKARRAQSQPDSFPAPRARPGTAPTGHGNSLSGSFAAWPGADLRLRHADSRSFNHGSPAPIIQIRWRSATCPMKSTAKP